MENKSERTFKYDAFISYRHSERDKFVAENLHKQLEAFKMPANVAKLRPDKKNKIERVFRDQEELPLASNLEDPIVEAIHNSEWLIVICSPRLNQSLWCRKEIETFISLRGVEHVLAVLVEGEPRDSFPPELLYKTEFVTNEAGLVEEKKIPIEPLAADLRAETEAEVLKLMKTEMLRLLAPMFEVDFDDLRQRHREQRMRRIMTASLIGGSLGLLFGVYCMATAIRIHNQKLKIEQQTIELANRQAYSVANLAEQKLSEGDSKGAIAVIVDAMEDEAVDIPYIADMQMLLTDALRVYDTGNVFRSEYQYETQGKILDMVKSPDSDTLAIYDDTGLLTLYNLENREVIAAFDKSEYSGSELNAFSFIGKDMCAYVHKDSLLRLYDLSSKEVIAERGGDYFSNLKSDPEGKYLMVSEMQGEVLALDATTLEEITTIALPADCLGLVEYSALSTDGIYTYAYNKKSTLDGQDYKICFYDLKTRKELSGFDLGSRSVTEVRLQGQTAYVACTTYSDNYLTAKAHVLAIDIQAGAQLWEYVQDGVWAKHLRIPENEGATDLLLATSDNAILIDMKNGTASYVASIPSDVVEANIFTDRNCFLLLCSGGEVIAVSREDMMTMDMTYKFEFKSFSNEKMYPSPFGYTLLDRNDNKITVYTMKTGPDVVISEEKTFDYPEQEQVLMGDTAVEAVREYSIEKPDYVQYVLYNEDKTICFIQYWDRTLCVYDVNANTVLNTMEGMTYMEWFLGTDKDGNSYLLGINGMYVLNKEMQAVAFIPQARGVDLENKKVYIGWMENFYEAPLYSEEAILEMGKSE